MPTRQLARNTPQTQSDPDQEEQKKLMTVLFRTITRFFGSFANLFSSVRDPRNAAKTSYSLASLCSVGILMFLFHLGSRRQINYMLRNNVSSQEKFADMFSLDSFPHGDTLNYLFQQLEVDQIQHVVSQMTRGLIRKKVFYTYRLFGYYTLVIDGTGMLIFSQRHCPHCLTCRHQNGTLYYHHVLEAKLVTPTGLACSIMTEFIENPEQDCSVQDCELKAFYRLAERLKTAFPRLPICLLLDGLYASGPTFGICNRYDWKFIITLKDLDLPTINEEFAALSAAEPENTFHLMREQTTQEFSWVNDLNYQDSFRNEHTVSVFQCVETKPGPDGSLQTTTFRWITNFQVHQFNVSILANKGGRLRWKIENEGFNTQKNGGYALEHAYSEDVNATKVFYFLMQIAHMIFQLIEKGSLFVQAFPAGFGSSRNISARLIEAWRNLRMQSLRLMELASGRFQIRFDSS